MEQTQGVEAVGGSRGVREGAVQAIQVFFVLFIVLVMARGFVSYYHTLRSEQTLGPRPAAVKAAKVSASAPAPVAKPVEAAKAPAPAAATAPAAGKPAEAAKAPAPTAAGPAEAAKAAAPAPVAAKPAEAAKAPAPAPAPAAAKPAEAPKAPVPAPAAAPVAAKPAEAPKAPAPLMATKPVEAAPVAAPVRRCPVFKFMECHPISVYRLPMFILIVLLAVRMILSLRSFDRLYAESASWADRSFTGLLIQIGFLLAQVGLLAFMAVALESEGTNDPEAIFLFGILVVSGLGYLWTRLTAGAGDRQALRYALPAGVNDLAFAAVIFGGLFIYAYMQPAHKGVIQGSPSALAAFLGIVNVYLNYLIAVRAPDDPALAETHVLRSWLAIGIGIIACAIIVAGIVSAQKFGFFPSI